MEDQLFNNNQPNESEEDRKIRELFFDTYPLKCEIDADEFYVVPKEGFYMVNNHLIKMKPGDIVRLNSEGVPHITSPS